MQWSIQLQNWTDLQQCSDAYNTEYYKVKLHRHLQTCMQWSIQSQNWTDTCSSVVKHTISQSQTAQTLTDMYAVKHTITKLNRDLQQCCEAYNITKTNCTDTNRHVCSEAYNYKTEQTCSSAVMHTILNITKSNCTDTYRHVCSEAYNYKTEQTCSSAVTHTISQSQIAQRLTYRHVCPEAYKCKVESHL